MNTFNIGLDLDKRPAVPEWVTIRQGDMNGTTIAASIYDHGTLLTGSYDARVCFRLPDGEHYYRKDATFSAGVATVTIDEQEAASVIGNTFGYFEILSGSTVIASTADFGVRVLRSATDGMTPGETYDNAIQDAIDGLNDAVTALPDTVEGILTDHPEWTTTVQDGSVTLDKLATTLNRKLIKSRGYTPTDVTLTDANAAERNSVIFITNASEITNLPTTEKCALITIGNGRTSDANTSATSICVQLCVLTLSPLSGTWIPRMWVRSRYGGENNIWSDWCELSNSVDVDKALSVINDVMYATKPLPTEWEIGTFSKTTGNWVSDSKAIVCEPFLCEAGTIIEVAEGWYLGGVEYDTSGVFTSEHVLRIRGVSNSTSCKTFVVENTCYLKVSIHRKDNTAISDAVSESMESIINFGIPDWQYFDTITDEQTDNLIKSGTYYTEYASIAQSDSKVNEYATARTIVLPITGGASYTICKRDKTRFRAGTSEGYPEIGTTLNNVITADDHLTMTVTAEADDKWLAIYYYMSTLTDETPTEALRHLTVVEVGTTCLPVSGETAVDDVARMRIGHNVDDELFSPSYYLSDPGYEEQLFNEHFGFSVSGNENRDLIVSQDIYDLWDGLVTSYPYNVDAGIVIGQSIDENGDSVGDIKAYRIHPREFVGQNSNIEVPYDPDTPTYFFTAGVHGREKTAQWGLYQLFARMLGGSNAYSGLLVDAVYWVVPCVCRWGCDHTSRYLAYSLVTSESNATDPNRLCTTPLDIPDYAPEVSSLINFLDEQGIGDNPNNVYIDFHNCDNIYTYLGVNETQIDDRYMYDSLMVDLANAWWYKSQDTTGAKSAYYGNAACANRYITRSISPYNPDGSIAKYVGNTYGIRTAVIHETLSTGVMVDGSSVGGSNYFTGEALAKMMDSQRSFVSAIHADNRLRLRSQVKMLSDGGIELFGKIKLNLENGGAVTWENL